MKIIAMIPARLGGQRLKQKNRCKIQGVPLIRCAIQKCKAAAVDADGLHEVFDLEMGDLDEMPVVFSEHRAVRGSIDVYSD